MARDIRTNSRARAAAQLRYEIIIGNDTVSADSLATLYVSSQAQSRFDPVTGAIRSLLDGGDLGLIRDDDLRKALAGWIDRAEEARMTHENVHTTRSTLAPILLTVEPSRSLSSGELAALRLDVSRAGYSPQLIRLQALIQEIVVMIEGELRS